MMMMMVMTTDNSDHGDGLGDGGDHVGNVAVMIVDDDCGGDD